MSSVNNEYIIQPKEGDLESQNKMQKLGVGIGFDIRQVVCHLKQLKSFEILKSTLNIFTSNTKFIFLMILSILPFFVFMVFFEIKLQKTIIYAPFYSLYKPPINQIISFHIADSSLNITASKSPGISQLRSLKSFSGSYYYDDDTSMMNERREFLSNTLQLSLFYLLFYPLLEFFTIILTMKVALKIHAAEKPATIREVFHQKVNIKGSFNTYICVHLLSTMTLLGLFWIVANHRLFSGSFNFVPYYFVEYWLSIGFWMILLSIAVHSVIFLGLLYKYLEWSAFWNMGIVISLVEEQTGIAALGKSDYYGKHCKKTGFQLMFVFFVFGNVLRLPCLYAGVCNGSVAGVLITCIVMMPVSLGNLGKWVASLLYFYYCKQQTMEKKVDDHEMGKTIGAGDK